MKPNLPTGGMFPNATEVAGADALVPVLKQWGLLLSLSDAGSSGSERAVTDARHSARSDGHLFCCPIFGRLNWCLAGRKNRST